MTDIEKTLCSFLALNDKLLEAKSKKEARILYESSHSGIDNLAKNEGVLLCFASDEAKKAASVATEQTFNEVCKLARNRKYSSLLFGENTKFDDIQHALNIYEQFKWVNFKQVGGENLRRYIFIKLQQKYKTFNNTKINNIIDAKASGGTFNNNKLTKFDSTTVIDLDGYINTRLLPDGQYREYDATIFVDNQGRRNAERFVVLSGGDKVYYTGQHYATFIRVK